VKVLQSHENVFYGVQLLIVKELGLKESAYNLYQDRNLTFTLEPWLIPLGSIFIIFLHLG